MLERSAIAANSPMLDNYAVYLMVRSGTPTETVIAKINASDPRFDTQPTELAKLKNHGVGQPIIDAMVDRQALKK